MNTPAPAIDIHTHILPPELPRYREKYGYGGFIQLERKPGCKARMYRDDGSFTRDIDPNCWDAAVRVQECDRDGVGVQVLSTVPAMFSYWAKPEDTLDLSRGLNDHLASVVSFDPKRFLALGTVPLQKPELAIRELERCIRELGFPGVEVGSHVNQWNWNAPELFPFLEAAQDLGACIFVHPWDMIGQERMQKYWLPWLVGMPMEVSLAICSMIFGGVFERLPRLRVAFAHGGGSFPGTFGRIQRGFEGRPDLCAVDNPRPPREYLGRFWVDSGVHDPETLKLLLSLFGEDKVALGSDYPFPLGEDKPGALIRSAGLAASAERKLLRENACAWLGRKA